MKIIKRDGTIVDYNPEKIKVAIGKANLEVDERDEKLGYKIREAQLEKVPYIVVVGDKDIENNTVSVRSRKDGDLGSMSIEEMLQKFTKEIEEKTL